jgi:pyrroline-5-carboxylate reductase
MSATAIIGCGNMGRALIRGLREAQGNRDIVGVAADAATRDALQSGEESSDSVSYISRDGELPEETDTFLIAVKPKDVAGALADWRGAIEAAGPDAVVISIAAGLETSQLRGELPGETALVRAMPNTPALVGSGVTGIWSREDRAMDRAAELFSAVGEVVRLADESEFDALTAVSGSGPAYIFLAIEAFADGAVAEGLDRETAMTLAVETILGATELARETGDHPGALKDAVTSPGGTTAAGLRSLEKDGFRSAWIEAVHAAAERSREMGEKN